LLHFNLFTRVLAHKFPTAISRLIAFMQSIVTKRFIDELWLHYVQNIPESSQIEFMRHRSPIPRKKGESPQTTLVIR
jgi:hypothetical protein